MRVDFLIEGDITEFIVLEQGIYLEPGMERYIDVSTIEIKDEPEGDYTGKVIVVFKRST